MVRDPQLHSDFLPCLRAGVVSGDGHCVLHPAEMGPAFAGEESPLPHHDRDTAASVCLYTRGCPSESSGSVWSGMAIVLVVGDRCVLSDSDGSAAEESLAAFQARRKTTGAPTATRERG